MSAKVPAPVRLGAGIVADPAPVPAERVLAGSPVATVANAYSDAGGRFHCGTWSSTPGRWRVSYAEHEFCHLLEGRVRLVADDGAVHEYAAGDAWVIPAGFTGTWETVEAARKYYAIYEG